MKVDKASGWLDCARHVPSPNCDDRPPDAVVDLVVIHSISLPPDHFGGPWIDAFFTNRLDPTVHPYFRTLRDLRVSAHALVRRDGAIAQYVPFHLRAWHAGESVFEGRPCCNDYSIGIELEGCEREPFEDVQYESLVELLQALQEVFPAIGAGRIVGHSDVAPGRKMDPGARFDWVRVRRLLDARTGSRASR